MRKKNKVKYNYKFIIYNYINKIFSKFNLHLSIYSNFLDMIKGNNINFYNFILKKYNKTQLQLIDRFLKKIKIVDSGYKLVRIGSNTDGGYLIPDILDQIEFCFSPGVGKTSSFEDHLKKFNIKSFLTDGTVNYNGTHDFTKKNLCSFNDENNITLETWLNDKIKDKSNDRLLLQMDIESHEIEVLCDVKINTLKRFKCIVIEFHNFHDIINPIALKIYSSIFNKILKTHFIVHMHPNNISRVLTINKNYISNLYEITFINKKIAKYIKKISYEMPHKLDKKCCSDLDEIKCSEIFYK